MRPYDSTAPTARAQAPPASTRDYQQQLRTPGAPGEVVDSQYSRWAAPLAFSQADAAQSDYSTYTQNTKPEPVPPWVDPALVDVGRCWAAPPSQPPLHQASLPLPHPIPPTQTPALPPSQVGGFARHPMWDATLNGSAMWTGEPSTSSASWSLPLSDSTAPSSHAPSLPSPSFLVDPSLATLPTPAAGRSQLGVTYSGLPDPPPLASYAELPAVPPSFTRYISSAESGYQPGTDSASSASWEPLSSTLPPAWPLAGPSATNGSAEASSVALNGAVGAYPPVPWDTAPLPAAADSASDQAAAQPASARSSRKGKGRAALRASKSTASDSAATAAEVSTGRARVKDSMPFVDDEDDFYPLPPQEAGAKPKKPRRKRRKMGEPPRDLAQRKYVCELCVDEPKSFARPSALRIHQLTHTKIKPHSCPVCFRTFAIISNLRRHQKLHENNELPVPSTSTAVDHPPQSSASTSTAAPASSAS
ncbi:hypothetical protein JCM8547_008290 [Rhodosporidiobolus lusitaniae]